MKIENHHDNTPKKYERFVNSPKDSHGSHGFVSLNSKVKIEYLDEKPS